MKNKKSPGGDKMADIAYLKSLLKDFGFSQYEAQVLVELYKKSPQTAKQVAKEGKISMGRIYEVLGKLREKGLLFELGYAGKTKLYELREFPESLDVLKEKKIKELNSIYYFIENELSKIERIVQESVSLDKDEIIILKNKDAIEYNIKRILKEAKKEVIVNFPLKITEQYNQLFMELSKRGIKSTYYFDKEEYKEDQVKQSIKDNKKAKYKEKPLEAILPIMIIVDKKQSLVILQDKMNEGLLLRNHEMVLSQFYMLNNLPNNVTMDKISSEK
jgi:sugar-specific transcriptional regulator TrmB